MKLSFILLFVLIFQLSATTYSQSATIDLSVNNMKVKDVLRLIESKTNFRFFYNDDLSELDRTLSLSSDGENINTVLGQIFSSSAVSYRILENNVIVIAPAVNLQQQKITGKVTDAATGEPIIGVNIIIDGTTSGTTTDIDGKYTIEAPNDNTVLVFSYIGYMTEKVAAAGKSIIDLTMVPDIQNLDEVVVIGYGTVKKRDLTGSVSSVKAEEIVKAPTSNALEAIQGKVSGVDIIRNSGKAGSGVTIRIRGNRSFGDREASDRADLLENLNKPIYVIDGIQGASYSDLNPNDIESIEILKDASTTAIYGWQGANGVIIITTKKAKAGKTKISYSGYYGVNGYTPYPEGRMGDDYIKFRREAYRTDGLWNSPADDGNAFLAEELTAIENNQWINWTDHLLHNGSLQNHQITVSNGGEKSNTYFSAGYYNEIGAIEDNYKRYNARFNTESNVKKWAKAGLQAQITYINNDAKSDALSKANSLSPLGTVYNADGSLNLYPIAGNPGEINPLTNTRENAALNNSISSKVFTSAFLEITPLKGLSIKTIFGANLDFNRKGVFNDSSSLAQNGINLNKASIYSANSRNVNWDNIITYSKELGNHSFTITGITSYTEKWSDDVQAEGTDQPLESYGFYNLDATDPISQRTFSNYIGSKTMSYAGRLNYSFKGKYIFTATGRLDGSSMLGYNNKWSSFPSVAAAWRVSDENFMKNIDFLNNLKLRFSYGEAGNASIAAYGTQSGINPGTKPLSFKETLVRTYFFKTNKANENLEWERSASNNIGLDLGLFKGRIDITADYYKTKTTGILMYRQLPISLGGDFETGFGIWQNIGVSENKGLEIVINTINIKTSDFRWTTSLTFSKNNEKIVSLINDKDIISAASPEEWSLLLGKPIGSYFNYTKQGIWQTADSAAMGKLFPALQPGDIKLADIDGNDTIDTRDRGYIGSKSPKWIAGLTNTFTYKSFDLSIFLYARYGQMINNELLGKYNPNGNGNSPAYLDYWTPENPTNDFPRPSTGILSGYTGYMTLPYVDGSFFKIKNITLGYTLPRKISQKLFIDNLRVYFTASNLLTVAKSHLVKYYDPENGGSQSTPMSKQFIFGANIDL